jgi:hypothetical protein
MKLYRSFITSFFLFAQCIPPSRQETRPRVHHHERTGNHISHKYQKVRPIILSRSSQTSSTPSSPPYHLPPRRHQTRHSLLPRRHPADVEISGTSSAASRHDSQCYEGVSVRCTARCCLRAIFANRGSNCWHGDGGWGLGLEA